MRGLRRWIWTAAAAAALCAASFQLGMRAAAPPGVRRVAQIAQDLAALRSALARYRADHGWYPGDPERDYNRAGRADLLRRQLTEFTRDDGRPAPRRDAAYCFGPYLREFPADPGTGSRQVVLDQTRSRAWALFQHEVEAGNGGGGWYYETRTGNIIANHGRGRARSGTHLAAF